MASKSVTWSLIINSIASVLLLSIANDQSKHVFALGEKESIEPKTRTFSKGGYEYLIGAGIADITGPAADVNLMGYAKPSQDAGGIHLRVYSRSVIIEDKFGNRILYTSLDNGMVSQLLRVEVLRRLEKKYGTQMFNESNFMISATHTHSAPGGFFQYMLYNIPSAGFISQTLQALADGIVRSVERANDNLTPGKIYFNQGKLHDASINRSPTSYANNPAEERALYDDNTDKTMYLLRMVDNNDQPIAMINWFAVHGTSMNNTNHLISSDNKGYASLLFEEEFNPPGTLPGKGKFVAIFAQANEGDVSPNTRGPRCIDTGLPCDTETSTCGNPPRNEMCIAFGPGKDMFESTKIIAHKQFNKARQLFKDQTAMQQISGPVRFIHEHIDITKQVVPNYKSYVDLSKKVLPKRRIQLNSTYHTCKAALGYSFAAGTTDGPGAFDFAQGNTASGRYWNMVRDFLHKPTHESIECHKPKPIVLDTGEMDFPYTWHPKIVPTQILMVGQLAIVGLPGEFTTMSGRRVRNAVAKALKEASTQESEQIDLDNGVNSVLGEFARIAKANENKEEPDIKVVLSGLSNIYTSYIATVEEYEIQRYEGASTLYGPHTLQAYVNQFEKLAIHLARGEALTPNNLHPPDLTGSLFTIRAGVIFDGSPRGKHFGSVLADVNVSRVYNCGDLVNVSFVSGNPRNDLRQEESFLYVDKLTDNKTWTPIATDSSWETKFIWERTSTLFGESKAIIEWDIPNVCEPGVYRIRHYGASKNLFQTISQYSGKSSPFKVNKKDSPLDNKQLDLIYQEALQAESAEQEKVDKSQEVIVGRSRVPSRSEVTEKPPTFSPAKLMSALLNWRWRQ